MNLRHLVVPVIAIGTVAALQDGKRLLAAQDMTPNQLVYRFAVRMSVIDSEGRILNHRPGRSYRVEKREENGRVKSIVTLLPVAPVPVHGLKGMTLFDIPTGGRFEDDGDGTPLRMFDGEGRPLQNPGIGELKRMGEQLAKVNGRTLQALPTPSLRTRPTAWRAGTFGGMLYLGADRQTAAAETRRTFGEAKDRVRGLDRYVRSEGKAVTEVLMEPTTLLRREVNRMINGRLVSRQVSEYVEVASGAHMQRFVRTEMELPGGSNRQVAEILTDGISVGRTR
jgi:hypothetical protein